MKLTTIVKWVPVIFGVLIGLALGWFLRGLPEFAETEESKGYQIRQGGYRLINPLLDCEIAEDTLRSRELVPFKNKVKSLIADAKDAGKANNVSVSFRDLNTGATFNINAKEGYSPASLAKLPVLIAYLKMGEKDALLLQKKIAFEGDSVWRKIQNFQPAKMLEKGKSYTVEDLLYRMMAYSDNDAWSLLFSRLDVAYLDQILKDLGVSYDESKDEDMVTVKSYAGFLRILYNASYLSKESSEKALQLLTVNDFPQGLAAGVPPNTVVASKFGERTVGQQGEIKQLHDFGIIYYHDRPYLLCVMTRGDDFGRLTEVIRDISKLVYEEMDKQVKAH